MGAHSASQAQDVIGGTPSRQWWEKGKGEKLKKRRGKGMHPGVNPKWKIDNNKHREGRPR